MTRKNFGVAATRDALIVGCVAGALIIGINSIPDASAASITWNTSDGDWFIAGNWDPAQVPQKSPPAPGDDAYINNGGTAHADNTSPDYPAGATAEATNLFIGAFGTGPAAASGTLDSQGVDIEATSGVQVGVATADAPDATGALDVSGADVTAGGTMVIGRVLGVTGAPATADGSVTVDGNVYAGSSLIVGSLGGADGSATGSLIVDNGNLTGLGSVGVADNASTGTVTGNVDVLLGDLLLRGGFVTIGTTFGPATASGTVNVAGAISLADPINAVFEPSILIGGALGGTSSGSMTAQSFDSATNSIADLRIGLASNGGDATGALVLQSGDLDTVGSVSVGFMVANAGGQATGTALLGTTSISGSDGGRLDVGVADAGGLFNNTGEGHAHGEMVAGSVGGFDSYRVGVILGTQHNDISATGSLTLGDGGLTGAASGSSVLVGASHGTPNNNQIIGDGGVATGALVATGGAFTQIGSFIVGSSQEVGTGIGDFTAENVDIGISGGLSIGVASYSDQYGHTGAVAPTGIGTAALTGGTLDLDPGSDPFPAFVQVGVASKLDANSDPSPVPVHAEGALSLTDVTLIGDALMLVGSAQSFSGENATAVGEVDVLRGSVALSSLIVGRGTAQGTVDLADTSLDASELVAIGVGSGSTGRLEATNSQIEIGQDLLIGVSNAPNSAPMSGTMVLRDSTAHVGSNVFVGPTYQGGAGALELYDSALSIDGSMRVGQSANLGALFGDGSVRATRSLVDVGGQLFLDIGASLYIDIDGLGRGSEYGAFDVASAVLDGILHVDFNFAPGTGSFFFDLIVSSLDDGILGDFDDVIVSGLGAGYAVTHGVVLDGTRGVEVYRISLQQDVPEPGTLGLLAAGLATLALARRRRS